MRRRTPSAGLFTTLFAACAAAHAQEPAGSTFGETVEVRVVNVEVIVTDRDGQAVHGLGAADFAIFEDGERQEITNFYRVEGPRLQVGEAGGWEVIAPDSTFRRRVLLLLDNNFIETPERDRAVAAVESYLDQKFDGSYEWAVVAVGDEVRMIEPFTADKLRVRAALDRVRQLPTFGTRYQIDRFFLNDPLRVRQSQREDAALRGFAGSGPRAGGSRYDTALRFESKFNVAATLHAFERTAAAMTQAFRSYSNLPGNKVLVWITGGVPMLPEYVFGGEETTPQGASSERDRDLREFQNELRELVDSIAWEANAAQFKVYPIKATGLQPQIPQGDPSYRSSGSTYSAAAYSAPVEIDDSDSAQLSLALGTGGLYLTSNRMLESLEAADRDASAYYSIGYRPSRPEDGKLHDLEVEVTRPGLVVRSRSGYVDLSPEAKLEMVLATPLPFPREKGTLPVEMAVEVRGKREVLATASLPSSRLTFVPEGDFYVGRVKIYLTIHDARGNLVDLIREDQDVRFPAAQRADALAGRFRYGLKFKLEEKGDYVVSVTVRDEATDEIGTAFSNLAL
jgi:VWFA-related protein